MCRTADFVQTQLYDPSDHTLRRSWCDGSVSGTAFADDYAWVIHAALELFQATGDVKYISWASNMQRTMDTLFWDAEDGVLRLDTQWNYMHVCRIYYLDTQWNYMHVCLGVSGCQHV